MIDGPREVAAQVTNDKSMGFRDLLDVVLTRLTDRVECEGIIKKDSQVSGFNHWVDGDSMVKTEEVPDLRRKIKYSGLEVFEIEVFL